MYSKAAIHQSCSPATNEKGSERVAASLRKSLWRIGRLELQLSALGTVLNIDGENQDTRRRGFSDEPRGVDGSGMTAHSFPTQAL